jgi:hypothetical protein
MHACSDDQCCMLHLTCTCAGGGGGSAKVVDVSEVFEPCASHDDATLLGQRNRQHSIRSTQIWNISVMIVLALVMCISCPCAMAMIGQETPIDITSNNEISFAWAFEFDAGGSLGMCLLFVFSCFALSE